jgi:hypothetical protein
MNDPVILDAPSRPDVVRSPYTPLIIGFLIICVAALLVIEFTLVQAPIQTTHYLQLSSILIPLAYLYYFITRLHKHRFSVIPIILLSLGVIWSIGLNVLAFVFAVPATSAVINLIVGFVFNIIGTIYFGIELIRLAAHSPLRHLRLLAIAVIARPILAAILVIVAPVVIEFGLAVPAVLVTVAFDLVLIYFFWRNDGR